MITDMPSILVVDDDTDICANVADILSDMGYDVDAAHDGQRAMQLITERPFDVVLLDLRMPGMDGLECCQRIRTIRPGTMMIVVSAYADGNAANEAQTLGVDVMAKPVDFPRLLGLIDTLLKRPLVLLVDDDQEFCQSLWDALYEKNYRICLAGNLEQAVERLGMRRYDVVLLDLNLGQQSGTELFDTGAWRTSPTSVIVVSGFAAAFEEQLHMLKHRGIAHVLHKPLQIEDLLGLLPAAPCDGETRH